MLTVHELRKRGYKIRVRHIKDPCYIQGDYNELPIIATTEVVVTPPIPSHMEGRVGTISAVGIAMCSLKDQFNRKRGTRIALGRAMKRLGRQTK